MRSRRPSLPLKRPFWIEDVLMHDYFHEINSHASNTLCDLTCIFANDLAALGLKQTAVAGIREFASREDWHLNICILKCCAPFEPPLGLERHIEFSFVG